MKEKYLQDDFNLDPDSLLCKFLSEDEKGFTLANYVDYMAENANQEALCHVDRNGNKRNLTYQDLKDMSNQMANYLQEKGVKRGDVVALVLRNNLEFFSLVLAIQKLGAVVMPLQYMSKTKQYKSIFDRANPSCIVAEDYELKQSNGQSIFVLDEIDKALTSNPVKLCVNRSSAYSSGWGEMSKSNSYSKEFQSVDVNTTDWGYLLATSGTTGAPKLVMHNYGFALANYYTGSWYGVEKGKKHFTICDSGWAMALWSMSGVLLHQGVLYINDYDRFNSEEVLKCIYKENIFSLCAPRSTLKQLLRALEKNPDLMKGNIKSLASAGEPLSQCDRKVIKDAFGIDLKEGYGMTEVVLPIYESSSGNWIKSPLYNDVTLRKEEGFDEEEIIVFGKQLGLLIGYLDFKGEEVIYREPPIEDDMRIWHTSDAGHKDENGNVCCDGRFGCNIKINDCMFNKRDVANIIKIHPLVCDCVVSSEPDEYSGFALTARVELNEGANLTEDDIKNYVKANMQDFCRPKFVIFEKLKRTPGGKPIQYDDPRVPEKHLVLIRKKHP